MSEVLSLFQTKQGLLCPLTGILTVSKGCIALQNTLDTTESVVSKAQSGRPKLSVASENQYIKLCSLREKQLHQFLKIKKKKRNAGIQTAKKSPVNKSLSGRGLKGRVIVSKPLLTRAKMGPKSKTCQQFTAGDWIRVLLEKDSFFEIYGSK